MSGRCETLDAGRGATGAGRSSPPPRGERNLVPACTNGHLSFFIEAFSIELEVEALTDIAVALPRENNILKKDGDGQANTIILILSYTRKHKQKEIVFALVSKK